MKELILLYFVAGHVLVVPLTAAEGTARVDTLEEDVDVSVDVGLVMEVVNRVASVI